MLRIGLNDDQMTCSPDCHPSQNQTGLSCKGNLELYITTPLFLAVCAQRYGCRVRVVGMTSCKWRIWCTPPDILTVNAKPNPLNLSGHRAGWPNDGWL